MDGVIDREPLDMELYLFKEMLFGERKGIGGFYEGDWGFSVTEHHYTIRCIGSRRSLLPHSVASYGWRPAFAWEKRRKCFPILILGIDVWHEAFVGDLQGCFV